MMKSAIIRHLLFLIYFSLFLAVSKVFGATGYVDTSFNLGLTGDKVTSIAVQSDDRIIIGGKFSFSDGTPRSNLARLLPQGIIDESFDPQSGLLESGLMIQSVDLIRIQPDGRILVVGDFLSLDGGSKKLLRLHSNGVLDTSFASSVTGQLNAVLCHNGKIWIGGAFNLDGWAEQRHLVKLNEDGSVDSGFATTVNGSVYAIASQSDDKLLIGGNFSTVGGGAAPYLCRLNEDGSKDSSFAPVVNGSISAIIEQPDNRILIAGGFTAPAGQSSRVARLLADGTSDSTFVVRPGGNASHMALLASGRIIIAGDFTLVNGSVREGLVRLLASGEVDTTFPVSGTSRRVDGALAVQSDGKILVGGSFNSFTAASGSLLARLDGGSSSSSLTSIAPQTVRWARAGDGPQVERVRFEAYDQPNDQWIPLGKGEWNSGGWEITSPLIPAQGLVRAIGKSKVSLNGDGSLFAVRDTGSAVPVVRLATRDGELLQNNDAFNFSGTLSGYVFDRIFYLRNMGPGVLRNLTVSTSGSSKFSVMGFSAVDLAPGASLPVVVRFAPTATGNHLASLRVVSNATESPFTVNLTSTVSAVFSPHFNSSTEVALASDGFTATGKSFGILSLGFRPKEGDVLIAVKNSGSNAISGVFSNLASNSLVTAEFEGETFTFVVGYSGNDGNDLTFSLLGPGVIRGQFASSVGSISDVTSIAKRPDGGILIGGAVDIYQGSVNQKYLALLDGGGNFVPSFNPVFSANGSNCGIYSIAAYPDGKVLVGGYFLTVNGVSRLGLVRLNRDGSIDTGFDAALNGYVEAISLLEDGKILVGGSFTRVGEVARARIARLDANGSADPSFSATVDGSVSCLVPLADGKILIGGTFENVSGTPRKRIARLNGSGALDLAFDSQGWSADGINSILASPDGGIFVAGRLKVTTWEGLLKLTPNGAIDGSFRALVASGTVNRLGLQLDGKLLLSGQFASVNGRERNGISRVLPDGKVDLSFAGTIVGGNINSLLIGEDGEVLVGGAFNAVNGVSKRGIARLANDITSVSLEVANSSTIQWLGTGAAPEYRKVSFEQYSPSLPGWIPLGDGVKAAGGWKLENVSLPAGAVIRGKRWSLGDGRSSFASETIINYGSAIPRTVLKNASGVVLAPGGSGYDFGSNLMGYRAARKLRIVNEGNGILENLSAGLSGAHSADFKVVQPPSSILPGQAIDLELEFIPSQEGIRSALLTVNSTDPDQSAYQLSLTGTGTNVFDPIFSSPDHVALLRAAVDLTGKFFGTLRLGFAPLPGTRLIAIDNTGSASISNEFANLADGSLISAEFNGVTYYFIVGYAGGSGNDLVFTLVDGPGIDLAFNPKVIGTDVSICVPEPDGGMVVGGAYSQSFGFNRSYFARLQADGTLDQPFNPQVNGKVWSIHRLESGGYLIGGDFTKVGEYTVNRLAKLNHDGSLDLSFNSSVSGSVRAVAIQKDGKVVIGGEFLSVNSVPRNRIARLNQDGTLDTSFDPGASARVLCITLQADGRILIGGEFSTIAGTARNGFARLESNGAIDGSMGATISSGSVWAIRVQPDGAILLGGIFNEINSLPQSNLAKIDSQGAIDSDFVASVSGAVLNIHEQADGKLLIGGGFASVNGKSALYFARLFGNGSLDESLNPQFLGGSVSSIASDFMGRIIVGGNFSSVDGVSRSKLARLENHPVVSSLDVVDGSTIRWSRGGTLSEVDVVSFEIRFRGEKNWMTLGEAERFPGGWELNGLELPDSAMVRARVTMVNKNSSYHEIVELSVFGDLSPVMQVLNHQGGALASPPQPIDFGRVPQNFARSISLLVTNTGLSDLNAVSAAINGSSGFSLSRNPAGSIPPLGTSVLTIEFLPTTIGNRSAELNITAGEGNALSISVPLAGTGAIDFSPTFATPQDILISQENLEATGIAFGNLNLEFAPQPGSVLTLVEVTGEEPIQGRFDGLPDGSRVGTVFNGVSYDFVIGYHGGSGNDLILTLVGPGVIDAGFHPPAGLSVYSSAAQRDGKILVGCSHPDLGVGVIRLNRDGSHDPSFKAVLESPPECITLLDDDTILISGYFNTVNGVARNALAKLRPDGSLVESFNARVVGTAVYRTLPLQNGKILIGGYFTSVGGLSRASLALLGSDGVVDADFTANIISISQGWVYALSQQQDGKIIVGGAFSSVRGVTRHHLARISETGAVDLTFNPVLAASNSNNAGVSCTLIQPDGKIIIGGRFLDVSGVPRHRLARLNQDGTLDLGFASKADDAVVCLGMQADGRILVAGLFNTIEGAKRRGIARLHSDGSLDAGFAPATDSSSAFMRVVSAEILHDGNVILGGTFGSVSGVAISPIAKLRNDPSELSLEVEEELRWLGTGSVPEFLSTHLEMSEDGGRTWTVIAAGNRIGGGWSFGHLELPSEGFLRARGRGLTSNRGCAMVQQIEVFGRSLSPLEEWRMAQFNIPTDESEAANDFNADSDGITNLMEYALGLDPKSDSSNEIPKWTSVNGVFEMSFQQPATVEGITYGAEWSETMEQEDWHAAQDLSSDGHKVFHVPASRENLFFRLKVIAP